MNKIKKIVIFANVLLSLFFLAIFIIGLKEWVVQLFIKKDGKMWLDWQITFIQVFFSLSGALSISMFFLLSIKNNLFLKRLYFIAVHILIISSLVYGLSFLYPQQGSNIFTRGYHWPGHIFIPLFISLIAVCFKNYWKKLYALIH